MRKQFGYNTIKAYTIKHMYEAYLNEQEEQRYPHVSYKLFRALCEEYFQFILDNVLYEGKEFVLPARMGTIFIGKWKCKQIKGVDFHATKMLGKTVWFTNEHSNGYRYKLYWKDIPAVSTNVHKYALQMVRKNKRTLAQLIKNKVRDYIEV